MVRFAITGRTCSACACLTGGPEAPHTLLPCPSHLEAVLSTAAAPPRAVCGAAAGRSLRPAGTSPVARRRHLCALDGKVRSVVRQHHRGFGHPNVLLSVSDKIGREGVPGTHADSFTRGACVELERPASRRRADRGAGRRRRPGSLAADSPPRARPGTRVSGPPGPRQHA